MLRILIFTCTILGAPLSALAQSSVTYKVMGAGGSSCGTWTYEHSQASESTIASAEDEWVLGFVVGQESIISSESKKNYTINTDANGILGWINNFCRQNPTKQIVEAATNFVFISQTVLPSNN